MMLLTEYLLYSLGMMATSLTAASLLIYMKRPEMFVQGYMKLAVLVSGMRIKKVNIGDMTIAYGERGEKKKGQSSILLLHGFSADKFMWSPVVGKLPNDLHVVAMDLPGHGDSDIPPDEEDLSFYSQIKRIKQFVVAIGLDSDPIHIVGLSMGGALAGVFSAEYPDMVDRVTMMCPAMRTPIETDVAVKIREIVQSILDTGKDDALHACPLIPKTPDEMQLLLDFAQFHKPIFMPKQIIQGAVDMRRPYNKYYYRLFKALAMLENSQLLEKISDTITVPTHLVWGEEDQVIHVSGAEILKGKLPNLQQVDIIPRCGHAINLDRPGAKTKSLLEFRKKQITVQL
ncbi:monoacylglycerol lipase ABHD6-like [Mytilus edulis]|uniref:monoacylglycerol lipase ABHD6-like n=1 Tax=Mytilus edulis TaxID=6550 RepID=UPI0039F0A1A8